MTRILVVLLCVSLTACRPPKADENGEPKAGAQQSGKQTGKGPAEPNRKLRIAVIPKGTTHEFWKSVHAGAEEAAEKLGVEILWKGPVSEGDTSDQINMVQDFARSKVDGICLAPLHSQALIDPVNDAVKAGILVLIFDSRLADESKIVSYVATRNKVAGALAAKEMAKRLNYKGNVILFRYKPGSESTEQREQGFLDEIARINKEHEGADLKVISDNKYLGITPEVSQNNATQVFNTHKEAVDGVFAVCEPNALGTLGALQQTKVDGQPLVEKVVFVGMDPNERMAEALKAGDMKGIVLQDPVTMGRLAVETIVAHIRGEKVEKRIDTGQYIATPETYEKHKNLLFPKQFGE